MAIDPKDLAALIREKYNGDRSAPGLAEDVEHLESGEPLAYVIGDIPFLGLSIGLSSRPLIPRPETEWWTEELAARIGDAPLRVLDLCAGSGAIGLSLLARCRKAHVSFGELIEAHGVQIRANLERSGLDASRADIRTGDLFTPFPDERFDIIASNPPYIPEGRALPREVTHYEPSEALYGGKDGLSLIRRILAGARAHLTEGGELWLECDAENAGEAVRLALDAGAGRSEMRTDPYGRPRLVVSYW